MMVQHHTKYIELHGVDEVVEMSKGDHNRLHRRLRKEGKCTVPVDELQRISAAAHDRSQKYKATRETYLAEHRDHINARQRAYYAEHKDEIDAYKKAYRTEHRDHINAYKRMYRAARKLEVKDEPKHGIQ